MRVLVSLMLTVGLAACCPGPHARIREGLPSPVAVMSDGARVQLRLRDRDLVAWPPARDAGPHSPDGRCSTVDVELTASTPWRLEGFAFRDRAGRAVYPLMGHEEGGLPWSGRIALCDTTGEPLSMGRWTLEAQLRRGSEVARAVAPFEVCSCEYH